MMALRHFTITTADGVVHKCCEDERAPGAAAIAAKVVIMKRDDDEPPSETDVLQTLDDEMRRAFREGRLPITSDGPASTALMHAVHLAGRASPHLSSADAFAEAWAELNDADQAAIIAEEKQALTDRLDAKRADEEAARTRSLAQVGKADAMDIITGAKLVADGQDVGLTKRHFHEELRKRAAADRRGHETIEQSYARLALEDPAGRTLFAAYRVAPRDAPVLVKHAGAAAEIKKLADAYRKANPGKSDQQAFAAVYTAPANLALKARYDAEDAIAKLAPAASLMPSQAMDFASYSTGASDSPRPAPKGGPATQALNALARQYQQAHPGKSAAQAFTAVYTAPEFREFKIAYDAEQRGPVDYTASRATSAHVA